MNNIELYNKIYDKNIINELKSIDIESIKDDFIKIICRTLMHSHESLIHELDKRVSLFDKTPEQIANRIMKEEPTPAA